MNEMTFSPKRGSFLNGRKITFLHHDAQPEWGGMPQVDSFAVLHPQKRKRKYGLYVVLHSAGHDLYSCLGCVVSPNNHDLYKAPEDMFGLYVDCRAHEKTDFWWGGINANGEGDPKRKKSIQTVEKRIIATVEWTIRNYPIDPERVYLSGISMGGSGTLGIGMRHGDIFAAVKVSIAAGVEHFMDRCIRCHPEIPDPPVCFDYSAQNDDWSKGHDLFYETMRSQRFALFGYWGMFGHTGTETAILRKNDLVHSFDWLSIRKNSAYPVFTFADCDNPIPWGKNPVPEESGQVNAFFRWKNYNEHEELFRMELYLVSPEELKTSFQMPVQTRADLTIRRFQKFKVAPRERIRWTFGHQHGIAQADAHGIFTIPRLQISRQKTLLQLKHNNPTTGKNAADER